MKKYKNKAKIDQIPLWKYLNLNADFLVSRVDASFKKNKLKNNYVKLAWKLLRDKYFACEYRQNISIERIFESGFFDDELPLKYYSKLNYYWSKTPVGKIKNNYKNNSQKGEYAVLLTAGAFSPIHVGHILYMNAAKEALEARGVIVLGGYFSPSHDDYVNLKDNGSARLDAKKRAELCRLAVRDSDWLMVDSWESLHVSAPIIFTLVYERLRKYLQFNFPELTKLKIYFVVGSDNAAYARAFLKYGYCICTERYGYKKTYEQIKTELYGNKNIIFIDYKKEYLKYSSSLVRQGKLYMLESKIIDKYKNLKKNR